MKSRRLNARQWKRMVNQNCKRRLGITLKQYKRLVEMGAFDWNGEAHCDLIRIEMLLPNSRVT